MIRCSIEIDRPPAEVFAYLDQLDRHGEWQEGIVTTRIETAGPTRVGTQAVDTRKLPRGVREVAYEITEHEPPRRVAFRGLDGPVRPAGMLLVEPLDGGTRSHVTVELDLSGHGLGKLIAPFARRQASAEIPRDQARLKQRLEQGAGTAPGADAAAP